MVADVQWLGISWCSSLVVADQSAAIILGAAEGSCARVIWRSISGKKYAAQAWVHRGIRRISTYCNILLVD